MKKKWEYLIADLVSLGLLEYGLFVALAWYWSKFQWSPFGYETCGMEFLGVLLITYPAFIIGLLIRLGLLFRWKVPQLGMEGAFAPVWDRFLRLRKIP
jgi:hypothetical protein